MTFHHWTTLRTVLLIGLLLAGWGGQVAMGSESAQTQNQQSATGALLGRVTRSPMVPVERSDHPVPPGPVAGARILVSNLVGNQIATVIADEHGEYRVDLPAGDYRVDMVRVGRFGLTKDLPATVTIRPGRETRLDVGVDSGIR